MTPHLVSVIVPMYNAADTIGEQIEALVAQDYPGAWELILADNGSTDGTLETIARDHPGLDAQIVIEDARRGAAHVRNAAVRHSRGDFLAFVDADDRVHPGWLTELVAASAGVDLVAGDIETESLNTPEARAARPLGSLAFVFDEPDFLPSASGCNLGVRRATFEAIDGFDPTFVVGQDVDFSWRAQLAGFTIRFAPRSVVAYRLRSDRDGIFRQMRGYGRGETKAYYRYRRFGAPRMPARAKVALASFLVLRNPLVPAAIRGVSVERWFAALGYVVGRVEEVPRARFNASVTDRVPGRAGPSADDRADRLSSVR
ncbi:glycosyltransferase [Millisia brevis]|uniref:glycosyltransferase n=1 Tax=Millisia brevis TaxID=264148 RepID=UPI00082E6C46|nr:glycosyltransferase [Millisia brevis]